METITIKITGSGTKSEINEALADLSDSLLAATPEQLERGIEIENSTLMLTASYENS